MQGGYYKHSCLQCAGTTATLHCFAEVHCALTCRAEKSSFLRRASMAGRSPRARARATDRLNVTPAGPPEKRDSTAPLDAGPPPPPVAAPPVAAGSKSRLERLLAGPWAAALPDPAAEAEKAMLSRAAEALPDATLVASTDGRRGTAEGSGMLRGGRANAVSAETAERIAQSCHLTLFTM